ncbi:glutathione S-transferase [Xylaria bambusicola]|uniref:glutathione S-transferase n=1 Tax=Xylaria bambusicola TaxID=326684 RepID=UPI002007A84F|nr:glutathione S-transferase [Xylaria bambusicola]KAI0528292.1 glutathione S-transferase [Xylaria bambusicola]
MASPQNIPIVLYHYDLSPYAKRLRWYLNLRKIPYSQCIQPRIMPRPDLSLLGVSYRRIPVLAIGKDVYLDTRLIIQKLETLFPPSAAHPGISGVAAGRPEHSALEDLISQRTIEGDLFGSGVQCFPASRFASDAALLRDRTALFTNADPTKDDDGGESAATPSPLSAEVMDKKRPAAVAVVRRWVRWLEEGLLADGRDWILDSNGHGAGPSLADLEAIWVLMWVSAALPSDILESAPKVAAWLERFKGAVKAAAEDGPALKGEEAAKLLLASSFAEPEGEEVRQAGLVKGRPVKMWPTDYGSAHKDAGRLVAADDKEFVIESKGQLGSVRIHAPRYGFTISADEGNVASQL